MSDRTDPSTDTRPTVPASGLGGVPERVLDRGMTVGRYLVLGELGAGGMGHVYTAFDPDLDRKVAIKLLRTARWGERGRLRLLREAQAMARLSHPNVVAVYDVGSFEDEVFIALELVDGVNVKQWLAGAERSWREVVAVFAQIARGLAAAHRAGIVHRDVKPANLLVGGDGRARVLDFGVARPTGDGAEPDSGEILGDLAPVDTTPSALATPLTQAGAVVGTPMYMAPEQRRGVSDARTDQFGFCLSLYEALYGRLPERDESTGAARAARVDADVPAWVHAVLERGLQLDRDHRFASMDEVADALGRDPAARRSRIATAAVAIAVIAGSVAFALSRARERAELCTGGAREIAAVWNDQTRAEVQRALLATDAPAAPAAWAEVERQFDAYVAAWSAMHRDACEASSVRGEQSAELMDARMSCLARRRGELAALVTVLAGADDDVVTHAVSAANQLGDLGECADVVSLTERVRPPREPEAARRHEEVRGRVAEAWATLHAGKIDEGTRLAEQAVADAATLGYRPLEGAALYALAFGYDMQGDPQREVEVLHRAGQAAAAGRDRILAARVWVRLIRVAGDRLGQTADAQRWVAYAESTLEAIGPNDELRARFLLERGLLAIDLGRFDQAERDLQRALAITETLHGADAFEAGQIHQSLGLAYLGRGDYQRALVHCERDVAITEAIRGPWHPALAQSLNNAALAYMGLSRNDDARAALVRAIEIWERSFGSDYALLAMPLHNLGDLEQERQQHADAQRYYARALALWERAHGATHPDLAHPLAGLADSLAAQGQYEDARAHYRRALELWEAARGSEHPQVVRLHAGLGETELRAGRPAAAIPHLERAHALMRADEVDPNLRGRVRFGLARALWDAGRDRARARTLAESARADFAADGARSARALADADAWLAQR